MWLSRMIEKRQRSRAFRDLYSVKRFRDAMNRERCRADRWGLPLSLLSFGAATGQRPTLLRVARKLKQRMRATDEAGWLDAQHIGVLMPNTPAWGAWTLADDICTAFPDGAELPECQVYCYPSGWFRQVTRGRALEAPAAPAPRGGTRVGSRIDRERLDEVADAMPPLHFSLRSLRVARRHGRRSGRLAF